MADTNITWNGTPIDSIERDSLSLNRINENGTIREMVNTINANFLNIAKHGGGPAGIDGMDGANGVDGANVEYIYTLCDEMKPDIQYPTNTYERINLFNSVKSTGSYTYKGVTWFDNARPISPEHKNEYVWSRIKRGTGLTEWYYASEPVLWAHWGEVGKDGDGVEYIFLASSNELTSVSLNTSLLKIENMDDFQKVIFNIDDFYPGKKWFNSGNNKQKVRLAISKKGLEISDSTFDTRWGQYFNFCSDTYSWTDEPTGTGPSVLYEYVSIRKSTTDENDIKKWGDFCTPALWSNYNLPTKSVIIYCNLGEDVTPEPPTGGWVDMSTGKLVTNKPGYELTPNYWKDTNDDIEENQVTWMSTGVFDHTGENAYWSSPVRITGSNGKNGEDGTLIEFIYALTTPGKQPDYPNITDKEQLDNLFNDIEESTTSPKYSMYGSTKWYDRAQAISADIPVEYMAQRSKKPDEVEWTYTEPIIWSHWGEDGTDGDGVEYIFATTQTDSKDGLILPVYSSLNNSQKKIFQIDDFVPSEDWFNKPKSKQKAQEILGESFNNIEWNNHYGFNVSSGWSDNPVEVSPSTQYQWVSIRRSHADEHTGDRFWEDFSTPVLWNSYGKRTRTFIVYCNISDETIPKSPAAGWWNTSNNTLQMSKTNASEYKSNALSSGTPDYTSYVGYWSDNNIDVKKTITWISTGEFNDSIDENGSNNISWSKPFRITGETGEPGADGSNMQFVYALCDDKDSLKYPQNGSITEKNNFFDSVENAGTNGYEYSGTTWYDHPQGVKNEKGKRTEWVWSRSKPAGDSETTQWETSPSAVIWSHWGEDGTDGDGVEYMFLISNSETYNTPTESNWNKVFDNFIGSTSDTVKYTYAMSDFLPTVVWLNTNKTAVQAKMQEDGKTFSESDWTGIKTIISDANLGDLWKDNPSNINSSYKHQFVSIRKMNDGEWGPFSYPKLWSKYATIKFKSIAFAATTVDTDLSKCEVTGGDFSNPLPTLTKNGNQTMSVTWTDGPEPDASTGKTQIWMTSANVTEGDESALVWSAPQKMTDTADFQVEWSSTDKTLTELATINNSLTQSKYNFGTFLKANNYSENVAELKWRIAMSEDFGILFGDNSENAILMATCQLKNGVWSDWKITRVKGEKGDAGTSVNIKDRIIYESYLTSGTEYNYENANNRRGIYTPDKTPENGDLLIVYPAEPNENGIYYGDASDGGKLYMWKYTNEWVDYNNDSIGEETGNTYVSPNGHLILWDGDSWGDLGSIVGPEGKSYTIAVKYAKDGKNGEKEEITNELEIPNAKWIGICVYEEGTTIPPITDPNWKWSLFKGQDGYGYEYIFKATPTNDSTNIPQVPQMPSGGNWHTTPNIIPDYWTDDPIEPTETDRYIWMCWRKFDHEKQQWTDFMGVNNGTSATTNAKLWHFYVTDGKPGEPGAPGAPGEAGNGYQYKYIRYDNSANYGSTICTVTNASEDEPTFMIGSKVVQASNSAQGADSGHTYEYRSERYGHTGSWSNWSNPVIIAKYLDDSDIQETVQREVQTATSGIEDSIKSSFQETINDVNSLKEHINPTTGVFSGTISDDTKTSLLSGYIKTNELSGEIEKATLSGFGTDSETGVARSFSEWLNYEDGRFTTANSRMDSLEGTLTTAVNDIKGKADSSALSKLESDAEAQFAQINNTVANRQYITDVDGYLLIKEADGSKRQALDKNGNPTKNYIDVRESDRNKLIFITTELASISQTVSDGIACTSIVTSTENGAAIFYQQVDDNGSKIYMDANTIGIHSDYFNLNNSGLEMTGNLLAKTENGIITAGVIGNDTAGNDIRFFAGPNHLLSPITKQKLIRVKNTTNTNDPSQIFVRYPSLDKKSTGEYIGGYVYELWDKDKYDYNPYHKFDYNSTFEYNGSTYYMWKSEPYDITVLTEERYYTTNNLKYHNGDFSLTPKVVAGFLSDNEYADYGDNRYIVDASDDSIYVDDFYDAYAWVLDSNSEGVSLYDYHNSSNEQLDTNVVIYTESENVTINKILGIQLSPTETSSYKVIDVSPSLSEAIKQSSFRIYEDGSIYANQGYIGTAKITASGIGVTSDDGFVLIGGEGIKIRDKYDNYSIISPSEITLSAALRKRNAYIFDIWSWDDDSKVTQLKKDCGVYPSSEINSAFKECDIINTFNQGSTFTIPSSTSLIGRQITLIGGSALCSMVVKAVEDAGLGYIISMNNKADTFQFSDTCKFYENGGTSSSLKLSNEGVDMIGVGFGNNFKGFVITNRFDINSNYNYGTKFKCLGMFTIDGSKITSYTFNGQNGSISSSTNSVTISTPFKINNMSEILVNISGESGNTTGITYNYNLSKDNDNMLSITVYSSNISKKFKVTVFNFGDFVSLTNDSSVPPAITKKEYSNPNNNNWFDIKSTLLFSWYTNITRIIRLTVNSAVKRVEYSLQSGSSYFTFASGSQTTPGNTTVNIGKVYTNMDNTTSSYRKGIIKITLHTSETDVGDKTSIITIPLEQDYYTQPSYGGGT